MQNAAVLCVVAAFFISGVAALGFETLWFRQAGLALGNGAWSSTMVLAAFMGGLALGNALGARFGDAVRKPLRSYVVLEVVVAFGGLAMVPLLPATGPLLAPWLGSLQEVPWLGHTLRLTVVFVLLLAPATAMGLTLPLLVRAIAPTERSFGSALGFLYGCNALGAVIGAASLESLFIPAFGVFGSAIAMAALSLVAALLGAVATVRSDGAVSEPRSVGDGNDDGAEQTPRRLLVASGMAGLALLALEVVWFRLLGLYVMAHASAFGWMLAWVLGGIGVGALAGGHWLRRRPDADRFAVAVAVGTGLAVPLSYAGLAGWQEMLGIGSALLTDPAQIAVVTAPLVLPVAVGSGLLFPLLGAAVRRRTRGSARSAGRLTLANTLGAAVGPPLAGFVLIPWLGVERSLFALMLVYGLVGLLLWRPGAMPRALLFGIAVAFAIGALLFPFGDFESRHLRRSLARYLDEGAAVAVREGQLHTLAHIRHATPGGGHYDRLFADGYSMSTNRLGARRYMKLFAWLPLVLQPEARRALLLGYGVGSTAYALTDRKSLERIDVVEISADVLALSPRFRHGAQVDPLLDPRVRVHLEDARHFLLTTDQRFDLITGEPPPPVLAGIASLYSSEYFGLLHARLTEGGVVSYWLPMHLLDEASALSVVAGFCAVFEDCSLWNGSGLDLILIGTRGDSRRVGMDAFARLWESAERADELRRLGLESPEQLGALFIAGAPHLGDVTAGHSPLVDDRPARVRAPFAPPRAGTVLLDLLDPAASRRRFHRSPFVEQRWPEGLRARTPAYFELHHILNASLLGEAHTRHAIPRRKTSRLEDLDHILTRSDLQAPALWLLGVDGDVQADIAGSAARVGRATRDLHLAIELLAQRRYAEAASVFSRLERAHSRRALVRKLHAYSLCLSRDRIAAAALLDRHDVDLAADSVLAGFESFMSTRCAVPGRSEVTEDGELNGDR